MGDLWTAPVEQTLSRLVAWDSISHQPLDALAGWLADRADSAGMRVERFVSEPGKINVVASAGPQGTDGLALSGHMDVVPVAGQDWTSDPFRLTLRDDRLVGRGTCDMKGFIAATVEAITLEGVRNLDRELVLVWTHDEEVGCRGSARLADTLKQEGRVLPRAMVVGEPTEFRVAHLHPGHASVRIVCRGRPAHSSRPDLGLSAIFLARDVLVALGELEQELREERSFESALDTPWTVLNVGTIQGGTAVNIVPEHCQFVVGFRPLPGQRFESILARLAARIAPVQQRAEARGGTVHVETLQCSEGLLTAPSCSHMNLLLQHSPQRAPVGVPFATDAGNLARLGAEPLVFGPGSIDVAHRPDEYLLRSDLARTVDIVRDLIRRRCRNL